MNVDCSLRAQLYPLMEMASRKSWVVASAQRIPIAWTNLFGLKMNTQMKMTWIALAGRNERLRWSLPLQMMAIFSLQFWLKMPQMPIRALHHPLYWRSYGHHIQWPSPYCQGFEQIWTVYGYGVVRAVFYRILRPYTAVKYCYHSLSILKYWFYWNAFYKSRSTMTWTCNLNWKYTKCIWVIQ